MNYIRSGEQSDGTACFGGKAATLAELSRADFPVPRWLVVISEAFYASMTPAEAEAFKSAKDIATVRSLVDRIQPSEALQNQLNPSLAQFFPEGSWLAVRSSAPGEDAPEHSFAGQLESYLYVRSDEVAEKIAAVWRSGFSERVLAYRQERGLPLIPEPPAVIIQRMVDAELSGVAFGADPISGDSQVAVVEALYGLGTTLVSGEGDADTYYVRHTGEITRRRIVEKSTLQQRDTKNGNGVRCMPVPAEKQEQPALDDAQVKSVVDLVLATGDHFGKPQDIEWAISDGELYLLQSRPITTLKDTPKPGGVLNIWDNSNIAESYSGITTPLTFSFVCNAYDAVYRLFCKTLGVSETVIDRSNKIFANMLGLIQGRIYYNLLNWYRMIALLPGFKANRKFMEQMMGVQEQLPDEVCQQLEAVTWKDRLIDYWALSGSAKDMILNHFLMNRKIRKFYARVEQAIGPQAPSLEHLSPEELVDHYRDLETRLLKQWDAPILNDFFTMIFYGVLKNLVSRWLYDCEETLQNDLLCGEGNMVSAEPARRLRLMAETVVHDPEWVELLCNGSLQDITERLPSLPDFEKQFRSYLDRFSDRCMNELKLESDTLDDNPLILFRSIGSCARGIQKGKPHPAGNPEIKRRREAEQSVRTYLAGRPLRRMMFHWVLRHARQRVRDRENLRFERTRVFGRTRRIFLRLGNEFHSRGVLHQPRDIFYLKTEEVLGFVEGRSCTLNLKDLVRLRKREWQGYSEAEAPPGRLETRGMVYSGNSFQPAPHSVEGRENADDPQNNKERHGLGCCPGIVRGKVRVVLDPLKAEMHSGDILVAERTDPGWIVLFANAAGLLVERGSLLSHAAIVSRELGIPSIVSLKGVTRWLKDGDWVEMDGRSGTVRRIPVSENCFREDNSDVK